MELLQYEFFQLALLAVAFIAIAAAIIGTYIITRRMVAIAGGVTHACFGGLGLGYFLGVSPVLMAIIVAIASSLGVEWMSRRMRVRSDSAIAVVWALGMAAGVLFVFLTPGYVPELNSFLFGNILTVTRTDVALFGAFTLLLVLVMLLWYRQIVACAFDPDFAAVTGLPVKTITMGMTVLTALCIVLTIRLVGVMLLMSMLSLPMMIAETFTHRIRPLMAWGAAIALVCSLAGLLLGACVDVPVSAIIVLLMALLFLLAKPLSLLRRTRPLPPRPEP